MHDPNEKMMVFAAQRWVGGVGIFGGDPRPQYPFFVKIFESGEHPPHTEKSIELFPGHQYRLRFDWPENGVLGCWVDEAAYEKFKDAGWSYMRNEEDQARFGEENKLPKSTPLYPMEGDI